MKLLNFFLAGLLIVVTLAFCSQARASSPDIEQETNVDSVLTGGDNTASNVASIAGSRSYGFSHGLGDVDINQCMGSTQWGTILVSNQKLVLNKWCAAEVYDAKGLTVMAAKLRCDIPEIAKHFTSSTECIGANTAMFHVEHITVEPVEDDDEDERIDTLYARLSDLEAQRMSDTEAARKAALRANAAAERAQQAETERREYAQQTLDALLEYRK